MLKDILTTLGLRPTAPEPGDALSGADRAALRTYLQECDELEPGIGEVLLDYLLTGRNGSALLRARALPGRLSHLDARVQAQGHPRASTPRHGRSEAAAAGINGRDRP